MKRIHLFEYTDLPWYPRLFRRMQTDYLQFAASLGAGHLNLLPLFKIALLHGQTDRIVDLCSGAGGPWRGLIRQLAAAGLPVQVILTDLFPPPDLAANLPAGIRYHNQPVDAARVPAELIGMRTLFEGFHHFKPSDARSILRNSAESGMPIGIFDASLKPPCGWLLLLLSPFITLLTYLLVTPFIRPRTFSRFLFTYLIPLVPLATCWDGVISLLRTYSPAELDELTGTIQIPGYVWQSGTASTGTPIFEFTYLIGYPDPPVRMS